MACEQCLATERVRVFTSTNLGRLGGGCLRRYLTFGVDSAKPLNQPKATKPSGWFRLII